MTWVKLYDDLPTHPKFVGISDAALAAYVRGLLYSSQHLLDGELPRSAQRLLGSSKGIRELVERDVWCETLTGWSIAADQRVEYHKHSGAWLVFYSRSPLAAVRLSTWHGHKKNARPKLPQALRDAVMLRDDRCRHCGSVDTPEIDHIVPLSRGGEFADIDNLQRLCRHCNRTKHARLESEL